MEKLFIKDLNKIYYLINSNHYDVSNMCKALNMLKDYKIINNLDNSLKKVLSHVLKIEVNFDNLWEIIKGKSDKNRSKINKIFQES